MTAMLNKDRPPDDSHVAFGNRLRQMRLASRDPQDDRPLTQERLADCVSATLGIDPPIEGKMIGYWERGARRIRHDRRDLLVGLVVVLAQCGGVSSPQQADEWLRCGGYAPLDRHERRRVNPAWVEGDLMPFQPIEVEIESRFSPLPLPALATGFDWRRWLGMADIDEHMDLSWRGRAIVFVSRVLARITPQSLLWLLLTVFALAVATPLLRWPLPAGQTRANAALLGVLANIVVPWCAAALTTADREDRFQLDEREVRRRLRFLKRTGAGVAWTSAYALLLMLVFLAYHFALAPLPYWLLWPLVAACVVWSHVAAARIPTDRYKMHGKRIDLATGDRLFSVIYLLFGVALPAVVYWLHDYLVTLPYAAWYVFAALLILALQALWNGRKATKNRASP